VLVHFVKLDDIDLGSLDDLDLSDGDILEGEDLFTFLGNFLGQLFHGEDLDDFVDGQFSNFVGQ